MCLAMPGRLCQRFTAEDGQPMGLVDFDGVNKKVNLALVAEAKLDDYLIIHAGFAITVLDQQEALAALQAFEYYQQSFE